MSYENFVRVKVVTPVTNVATSFAILDAVAPQKLPPADGGYLVLCDSPGNPSWIEVIQYTSRSGLGISGVTRGVEGTTAVAWTGNVYAFQALMAGEANLIQATLAGKEPAITVGTTAQYWRGDKSFRDFFTDVRASTLTGLSTSTNAVITAADTVLSGLGKLQRQLSDALTGFENSVRGTVLAGYLLGSSNSITAADTVLTAFGKTQGQLNAKAPLASPTFTGIPLVPTAAPGTNTTQASSTAFVQAAVASLINGAPGALDALNELAAAMGNDPNFATTMTNALAGKEPSIVADTVNKFYSGTKTWRDLPTDVRAVVLTGLSLASSSAVVAGDTLLVALGKLQKQCDERLPLAGGILTAPNLNTAAQANGLYYCNTPTNGPQSNVNGWLFVECVTPGNYLTQKYVSAADGVTYTRACLNTVWGAWKEVLVAGSYGLGPNGLIPVVIPNNAFSTGFYKYSAGSAGAPADGNGGSLIVNCLGGNYVQQIAMTVSVVSSPIMYYRHFDSNGTPGPWVKMFHNANIVGTVSQTSGTPTGAIIETGSNANGTYTKYADGTMICRGKFQMPAQGINTQTLLTVTHPGAFINNGYDLTWVPLATVGTGSQSDVGQLLINGVYMTRYATYTYFQCYAYKYAQIYPVDCSYIAVGRWF